MDDTVPTDLKILTTRTRMKVLTAIHAASPAKMSADVTNDDEKRERLLSKAVDELISTERSYVKHLNIVVDFFMTPLQEQNLISTKAFNVIFGQFDSILNVNRELLFQLETRSKTIGEAFLELAPFLKIYSAYVKSYDGALALIETLEKENKEFAAFKTNQESRPEIGLKLSALLITPVQRIPRFKLLLEEIIQYTPPEVDDYILLQDALREVTSVASLINHFLHEHDNMQKMLKIQRALTDNQPNILIPGRRFIKEGPLKKVSRNGNRSHDRTFFLFSDMLMYCKQLAEDYAAPKSLLCCCVIPIKHCTVDVFFNAGIRSGTLMSLKCKDEQIMLYTDDADYGNSWVESLRSTVRQYSEFRRTLKKESTAKRPLRRAAILKIQKDSISKLSKKRKAEAGELDEIDCNQTVRNALYPLRQVQKAQGCLTPKKKQRMQLAPEEREFDPENPHLSHSESSDCQTANEETDDASGFVPGNDAPEPSHPVSNRPANSDSLLSSNGVSDSDSDTSSARGGRFTKQCVIL